ncbi:hypothetical protein BgiMline_033671 [Biomphalaria glabrata]|nr:hypothetical protein BgiMline_024755 [Biomphalaria glabrata]
MRYQPKVMDWNTLHVYGEHECQSSEGGKDLHQYLIGCEKNPGHTQFIPVHLFSLHHLPEDYRDIDLYDMIMAEAQLTVRVDVKIISPNRPQFWPGTEQPYPFFKGRGKKKKRFGSGEIDVYKYVNGHGYDGHGSRHDIDGNPYKGDDHSCPCKQCRESKTPSDVWWVIIVRTATHVVFDAVEARQTSLRLFHDKEDSPTTILNGFQIGNANVSHDKCSLSLVTWDVIGAKLFKMVECLYAKTSRVVLKYRKRSSEKLNFIVSHPHGCSKQVSLGRWVVNEKVSSYNNRYDTTRLTYTTCTCPGSSGASVQCVGVANSHYHSGALSGGRNVSGAGFYSCKNLL